MEKCVFDKGEKCAVLVSQDCEKCTFRKTQRELVEGRAKAHERIEHLPQEQHDAIMRKYYHLRRCEEVEQ